MTDTNIRTRDIIDDDNVRLNLIVDGLLSEITNLKTELNRVNED